MGLIVKLVEHGLVHGDFGTHNIGKFKNRWKLLGVGGSKAIGSPTDPKRGFYHPPETVVVDTKRAPLGKKEVVAKVVSIPAQPTHDIWAFGVVMYEAICGVPLSPYACRGKRAMSANEVAKIGRWDQASLDRALRHVNPNERDAVSLLRKLLHHNPNKRYNSLREVLEHSFFDGSTEDRVLPKRESAASKPPTQPFATPNQVSKNGQGSRNNLGGFLDQENSNNGISRGLMRSNKKKGNDGVSVASAKSRGSVFSRGLRARIRRA